MRKSWKTMKKYENNEKIRKNYEKQNENNEKIMKNIAKTMKKWWKGLARGLRPNNWLEDFDPSTRGTTTGHYNGVPQRET